MKIFLWKKWRFRLRWDSSPGLESQRSRKRHFFHRKIFKFFKYSILNVPLVKILVGKTKRVNVSKNEGDLRNFWNNDLLIKEIHRLLVVSYIKYCISVHFIFTWFTQTQSRKRHEKNVLFHLPSFLSEFQSVPHSLSLRSSLPRFISIFLWVFSISPSPSISFLFRWVGLQASSQFASFFISLQLYISFSPSLVLARPTSSWVLLCLLHSLWRWIHDSVLLFLSLGFIYSYLCPSHVAEDAIFSWPLFFMVSLHTFHPRWLQRSYFSPAPLHPLIPTSYFLLALLFYVFPALSTFLACRGFLFAARPEPTLGLHGAATETKTFTAFAIQD